LVVLNCMPLDAVASSNNFLLADAGKAIGGAGFSHLVSIDAFLVLWGAVLTAFVGVSGLMHRMASDAVLPSVLAKPNKRGSYPFIVWTFFFLCSSIFILPTGNLLSLAGVYTIAFLG